jgi:hypothetical protein
MDDWLNDQWGIWGAVGAHLVGAGGMMVCNAGSNMAVVGCFVDAERGGGQDICWPMDFWTQIVRDNCAGWLGRQVSAGAKRYGARGRGGRLLGGSGTAGRVCILWVHFDWSHCA